MDILLTFCPAALPANHVQLLRELRDPSNLCLPDEFYENNALMDLELDFGPVKMLDGNWPRAWDDALQSIPPMRLIKALKRWPRDWIKTQPDPNKFTNKLTTEYAKETYESDPCHMEEYEWRKWIQIYNPPRTNPEAWSTLRNEFKEKWENMTPPVTPTTMIRFKKRPARLQSAEVGKDYYHFTGKGTVPPGEKYQIRGNLHAVAPVEDIPGWQRISFMQSRVLPNGQEAHECCEGVVLPGNKIILGRVWALGDGAERYSIGPFIFWNVEQ